MRLPLFRQSWRSASSPPAGAALAAEDKETEPSEKEAARAQKHQSKPARDTPPPATKPGAQPVPEPKVPHAAPSPAGSRERPQVVRTSVPQLVPNEENNRIVERADRDIPSAIVVGFGNDLAIAWDTRECRWLYAWQGGFIQRVEQANDEDHTADFHRSTEITGELVHLNSGPAPLSVSMGAAGGARYFGHRMVDGVPEFLYTVGKLKVSEQIYPSEDGSGIVQKFSVERHPVDLILAAPFSSGRPEEKADDSANREPSLSVTNGDLKGDYIYVDARKAGDFTLHHRIGEPLPRTDAPMSRPVARPVAIPLLTQADTTNATQTTMPPAESGQPPTPAPQVTPKPRPSPEPESDALPKPGEKKSKPAPASIQPTEPTVARKVAPVITKAQRYDRDILLTDPHVETGSLKPESTAFSDRDFKFTQLPDEIIGADHVRTFDRDKYIPGDILSYQLELDNEATVWLMFDKRVKPLPKWVGEGFTSTGKVAVLDSGETFQVLRADVGAGKLRLGPQDSGAGAHFYLIAASARSAPAPEQEQAQPTCEVGGHGENPMSFHLLSSNGLVSASLTIATAIVASTTAGTLAVAASEEATGKVKRLPPNQHGTMVLKQSNCRMASIAISAPWPSTMPGN